MILDTAKSLAVIGIGFGGGKVEDASAEFNTRLGGLPNKIRNICLVMVSLSNVGYPVL